MNTLQVLINQVLGVFIFLLLSRYLEKEGYGELNWSLAVLTFITSILSLRLEQIVVRNVAAGKDPSAMLTLFITHNLTLGLVCFGLLLGGSFLFPAFFHRHSILWILSISQLLTFFALPFRQLATGKSAFGWLALLSIVSNLIRCAWLGWLAAFSAITIPRVLVLFTVSALVEFGLGGYIVVSRLQVPFRRKAPFSGYRQLIKESLPQVGLVFLTAGIARVDWILMGLFSTPAHTAEYSFAYRAYEFSPLPLLVLAPFLLNSFSRLFGGANADHAGAVPRIPGNPSAIAAPVWLNSFARLSAIFATLFPLWLVLAWSPLVDLVTNHKYGQVNAVTFLILSACIPCQYLINIFWSADFAANRLRRILRITAITGVIVVVGDFFLIPVRGGVGAALVYLAAMIVQCILYTRGSLFTNRTAWAWGRQMLMAVAIAAVSGGLAIGMTDNLLLRIVIASLLYAAFAWAAGWMDGRGMRTYLTGIVKGYLRKINWPLLLFLVTFLNVKLYIKIVAIFFAIFLHRKTPFPKNAVRKKWLWFYLAMIGLAGINRLLSLSSLSMESLLSFGLGCSYWLLAMGAAWQIFLFVQEGEREKLHRTAELFFFLHIICTLASFAWICWQAGTLNPYTFEGMHRKYFISTGDYITGISLEGSVATALINAMGLLYFLYRNRKIASLLGLVAVLLAGSNFIDLLLLAIFGIIFIVHTNRAQKGVIVLYVLLMVVFSVGVSPQNKEYVRATLSRLEPNNVYVPSIPLPHPRMTDFVEKSSVVQRKKQLASFMDTTYPRGRGDSLHTRYKGWNHFGRWVALQEMNDFFYRHPVRLLLGAGMGNYSSRLAFKTAALGIDGGYPQREQYIHPFFRDDYLFLYLYYHTREEGEHSVVNKPDSVYGQLLGEYGLAGLLAFLVFYVGFFLQGIRSLSYGMPLLLLMGAAFLTEYWFEQLSVVVLFEFLMLLDQPIPRHQNPQPPREP
jgi:O-antigen/teichoic acid export membrane protein